MSAVRIPITELQPGMYVLNPGSSWLKDPLIYMNEGVVTDQAQIRAIIQQGFVEVFHDPERAVHVYEPVDILSPEFARDLQQAKKTHAMAYDQVKVIMTSGELDSIELDKIEPCVRSIVDSINTNANAMFTLAHLNDYDEYTFKHSVNVAVFAISFARFLGLTEQQQQYAGMIGLLHDYGKALVPKEILTAPRSLSAAEFTIMRSHVVLGYEALRQLAGISPEILEGILQHHEKHDGSGYPFHLKDTAIGIFGRIISICDVYDALSSRRVYKAPICPSHLLGTMYKMTGAAWPRGFVDGFIRMVGIYPVGTAILLSDGRVGIVSHCDPDFPSQPTIATINKIGEAVYKDATVDLKEQGNISVVRALTSKEMKEWNILQILGIA